MSSINSKTLEWAGSPVFAISLYLIMVMLSLLSLWSPPFKGRGVIFSTIIAILLYTAQRNPFPRDPSARFSLAMLWHIYLSTCEKILFTIPEKAYWRLDRAREEAMAIRGFSLEKLNWALALMVNMRGIGWNFKVKGVPAGIAGESRRHFLVRQGTNLVLGVLVLDTCSKFIRAHRYQPGLDPSTLQLSLAERLSIMLAIGIQSYFANHFNYQILSILGVGTGLSEAKDWPPLFGKLSDTTTIRHFWGYFWHQGLRKMLSAYTQFILRLLPRHTILSSALTLVFAFSISGLYHGYASYALAYPTPTSPYTTTFDRFGRYMVFFLAQPLGIMIEDFAIKAYRNYTCQQKMPKEFGREDERNKMWQRLLGYSWVLTWLMLSGNVLVDAYLKTEMGLVGSRPTR